MKKTNDYIVNSALRRYMIPAILSFLSMTIASFIGGIIMGQLIGTDGLAMVSIMVTFITLIDCINSLIFSGAAVQYSIAQSRNKKKSAHQFFTWCIISIVILGVISTFVTLFFIDEFLFLLGAKAELIESAAEYMRIILLSAPIILVVKCYDNFVCNDGHPNIVLADVFLLQIFNIIFTLVFIAVFDMGVSGAAYAIICSNIVALIFYAIHYKKYSFKFILNKIKLRPLLMALSTGFPSAVSYFGAFITFSLFTNAAFNIAGTTGVAINAVVLTVMVVFQGIIIDMSASFSPIYSSFYGEQDMAQLQGSVRKAGRYMAITICILTLIQLLFARPIIYLYGLDASTENFEMAVVSLRLAAISIIFYSYYNIMDDLYIVLGYIKFNTCIGIIRTLILPAILLYFMVKYFGYIGIWYANIARELIIALVCLTFGYMKAGTSKHKFSLVPFAKPLSYNFRYLITAEVSSWEKCREQLQLFFEANTINEKVKNSLFLAVEEAVMNICEHGFTEGKKHSIEILLKNISGKIIIRIRDDGVPFNAIDYAIDYNDVNRDIGIKIIKGIASSIEYNRILGFNNLIITI